jgi:ribokinase
MSARRVAVFGPAYLDRVLRVDRPLADPALGPPIDQSDLGQWKFAENHAIAVVDPAGYTLEIELPSDWPGPTGEVRLARPLRAGATGRRMVRGLAWHDDLGGMGAGYAAALAGTLTSALGGDSDAMSRAISLALGQHGVRHNPIRVTGHAADWTLLLTSGACGDKLPIGFRGCHARLLAESLVPFAAGGCDLRVVASLPNRVAAALLRGPGAGARLFAPSVRNMLDRDCTVSSFAAAIDVLACNRSEWELLEDREATRWQLSVLAVTGGRDGSTVWFTTPEGDPGELHIPAFPRDRPPRDTNRAGETFAATLITTLLDHGWIAASGVVAPGLMRRAAERAAAAAALVLDHVGFGFPGQDEVDAALRDGRVK